MRDWIPVPGSASECCRRAGSGLAGRPAERRRRRHVRGRACSAGVRLDGWRWL